MYLDQYHTFPRDTCITRNHTDVKIKHPTFTEEAKKYNNKGKGEKGFTMSEEFVSPAMFYLAGPGWRALCIIAGC